MFIIDLFEIIKLIILAPFMNPILLWHIIPLLSLWITLEIYFAFYKHEKVGWNTALANSFSLLWITATSFQVIFSNLDLFSWPKFFILTAIGAYAITLTSFTFRHKFSERISFMLAAPTPIHYLSLITFLYAYGLISFSWIMLFAILLVFGILVGFFQLLKLILPSKEHVLELLNDDDKQAIPNIGLVEKQKVIKTPHITSTLQGDLEIAIHETAREQTESILNAHSNDDLQQLKHQFKES